jgi:ornithine cyclodeaminase/alanine dehydrogenase-like protein (mu-crystallin family)
MLMLRDDNLAAVLDWNVLIAAMRQGHSRHVDALERLLLSDASPESTGANHFLLWPAWRFGDYCGVKLVTVFPGNASAAGADTNATVYVLFDGLDGRPLATMEGSQFTLRKTAADSALGASFLARPDAATLLMVGAGAQASWQVRALLSVRPSIRRIAIWNRTAEKAVRVAKALVASGVPARAVDDLDAALPSADIVSAATAATAPLIRGALLAPGAHVDLVGGFTPQMREADDAAVRRASVFVDSRRFTLGVCGDISQPVAAGVIAESDVRADLFDLCQGRHVGRRSADEITLFKNGGGGHLDLMTAIAAFERSTASPAPPGNA